MKLKLYKSTINMIVSAVLGIAIGVYFTAAYYEGKTR